MSIFEQAGAWLARTFGRSGEKPKPARRDVVDRVLNEATNIGERVWKWLEPPTDSLSDLRSERAIGNAGATAAALGVKFEDSAPEFKMRVNALFADWLLRLRRRHAAQMARAKAILGKLALSPYAGEVRIAELTSALAIEVTLSTQVLRNLFAQVCEAENEYVRFRYEHNLGRVPQFPDRPWAWLFALILIVVVEGGLNGVALVYMAGMQHILNAVMGGALISLSIVSLGAVTGFVGLRYLGFRVREQPLTERFWRSAGAVIAAVSIGLVVAIVVLVFISRMHGIASGVAAAAINGGQVNLASSDAVPPIVFAMALTGLSVFTYFFSVLKSYEEFADPFPGYSRAFKRRREARARYERRKSAIFEKVRLRYGEVSEELSADLEGQRDQVAEIRALQAETGAWDSSARQEPAKGWAWVLAQYGAFDEGYATVVSNRRETVTNPPRPTEFVFDDPPDFGSALSEAERLLKANEASHQAAVVAFAGANASTMERLVKEVENWIRAFANRHRPFGDDFYDDVPPPPRPTAANESPVEEPLAAE